MATRRSDEIFFDETLLDTLWRIADEDSTIRKCISILVDRAHQGGLKFYANNKNLKLTQQFGAIVDTYWLEFSRDLMRSAMVQGFACCTFVMLASGDVVPRVVPQSTVIVSARYDPMSEMVKYTVYRKFNICQSTIDDDEEKLRSFNEPDESMRIDMGSELPQSGEKSDPTIFVIDSFGEQPRFWEGDVRSPVRSLLNDYYEYMEAKAYYREQQQKICNELPYISPKGLGDDAIRAATADHYAPGDSSESSADLMRNRTAAEVQAYLIQQMAYEKNRMERNLNPCNTAISTLIHQLGAINSASSGTTSGGFNIMPPGSTMTSFHTQTDSRHLPTLIETYKNNVFQTFQLPPNMFSSTGSSNQDIQQAHLESTIFTWYTKLTQILTNVYATIYFDYDNDWYRSYMHDRWLSYESLDKVHEFTSKQNPETSSSSGDEPYLRAKNGMFGCLTNDESPSFPGGVSPFATSEKICIKDGDDGHKLYEVMNYRTGKKETYDLTESSESRKRKREEKEREPSGYMEGSDEETADEEFEEYSLDDSSDDGKDEVPGNRRFSKRRFIHHLDSFVYNGATNTMFENLTDSNREDDNVFGVSDDTADLDAQESLKKTKRRKKERLAMFIEPEMRIRVTLARTTCLTIPQLLSIFGMGAMDSDELIQLVRGKANLQPHDGLVKYQKLMDNAHQLVGGISVQKILEDTALAPLLSIDQKQRKKNEDIAVEDALRKQRFEYELKIEKMRLNMAANAKMQADQAKAAKAEAGKSKDETATSIARDKEGDMKKEQREEARKSGDAKAKAAEAGKKKMTDQYTVTGRKKGHSRKGNASMAD